MLAPLQTVWSATGLTVGVGLTTIVNVCDVPVQVIPALVYTGVTVISAVMGDKPVFTAVKAVILPVPLAGKPI